MGTWGTAISSNDTFAYIYDEFFYLYNEGLDVAEISKKLIADNQETINDADNCNNFWFAIVKAQWECKLLDKDIFDRVKKVIETGADLEVWRQLDADEKIIIQRKVVLDKFLTDLQTERPKAKSRRKKIIRQPVFEKGDCLIFKLANGNYSGVVVLEAVKDIEFGCNLIASTRINQVAKPTKRDFEVAEVLLLNYESWDNKENINWYVPLRHNTVAELIEKVDKIEVELNYYSKNSLFGTVADFDFWFIDVANEQFESEQTKAKPSKRKTIKELTKNKSKWNLW